MLSYWVERLRPSITLPLAVLIAIGAGTSVGIPDVTLAFLLTAQFRLWDDLEDRERDREFHPDRVIPQAASLFPFAAACAGLGALNLGLAALLSGSAAVFTLLLLDMSAAAYYTLRPGERTRSSDLILLAKYPAFVLQLSHGSPASAWFVCAGACAIYAVVCAFEVWHDGTGPLRVRS
jgi:hypothetical protein